MSLTDPIYPVIKLNKGKDEAVKRYHPWIFSGAIATAAPNLQAGDIVTVTNADDEIIGTGFCEAGNIAVKLLSFENTKIGAIFWQQKINAAFELRKSLGFIDNAHTNCFRLVHSEGDGLPGLVIDIYGKTAVVQAQTAGMALHIKAIAAALEAIPELKLEAIYNKSFEAMQRMGIDDCTEDGYLSGNKTDGLVVENDSKFSVDWAEGQKTGFFLDQRDNRELVRRLAEDRTVLNAFCYTGGFSVTALRGGARQVVSVDSSKKAVAACEQNLTLNGFSSSDNPCIVEDAKSYLQNLEENKFDMIILDPPAFVKAHKTLHKGLLGYKFINFEAISKIKSGGLLFTFSCSQAVERSQFQSVVLAAAIEAKRKVQILHQLSQPEDHPINIFHPESAYLKGLALRIY